MAQVLRIRGSIKIIEGLWDDKGKYYTLILKTWNPGGKWDKKVLLKTKEFNRLVWWAGHYAVEENVDC